VGKVEMVVVTDQGGPPLSANFKAPGLNGITYELWKTLDARCQTARSLDKPAFDILRAMTQVFNEIETHGIVKGTGFAESWMCPLYKKNDKADIANYRPISLLNTDYKIFTKALTMKLAEIAPSLIHPSQAGFVPGRHIYDQIRLTKRIIELEEATDMCGVIVALDQEKAYDKIEHDY
jgi:Reverse transcriptase (RNA-dependent DNA polymerase)